MDGALAALSVADHEESLAWENGFISHRNAIRGRHGFADREAGLGPDEIGLTDRRPGKHGIWRESLEELEFGQGLICQFIETRTQHAAFDRILVEDAVEPLHRSQLFAALGVHWVTKIWPAVETLMYLPVAVATKRDAVASLELCLRQEDLPADMMR